MAPIRSSPNRRRRPRANQPTNSAAPSAHRLARIAGKHKNPGDSEVSGEFPVFSEDDRVPLVGLEQTQESQENSRIPAKGSAPDSAFSADLQQVINAWPGLSEAVRAAIVAMAKVVQ
jgi:hypothetical protein